MSRNRSRSLVISMVVMSVTAGLSLTSCSTSDEAASIDRQAGSSKSGTVAIKNDTKKDITVTITGTDNFDWDSGRPDNPAPEGFQNVTIGPGEYEYRGLYKNYLSAGAPFTINFEGTGASIELQTKTNYEAENLQEEMNDLAGWGLRGDIDGCQTDTIISNGYTITASCGTDPNFDTVVTISR
jgi:hypothetical protein